MARSQTTDSARVRVEPGGSLNGELAIPGDKSISHRAVMFSALADGRCSVSGCLMGEDVMSTMEAFRAMGVAIEVDGRGELCIDGVGVDGLRDPAGPIDLGNSGTSMRLLCGILAGAGVNATLTGDASLSRRPMRRVADPLVQMGGDLRTAVDGTPPVTISASPAPLVGIDYRLPVASAQVKSALLLAGLFAAGRTRVEEPAPTRDHTECLLGAYGVELERGSGWAAINGGQRLRPTNVAVPADISSAAFFLVGASIATGSELRLGGIGINPTRTGILDILQAMGADIAVSNRRTVGAEPVADITVRAAPLTGIEIPPRLVPLAIDEFPAIFIAAAAANGTTVLREAAELRHKESDRIAVMAAGLATLGVKHEVFDDGIAITGGPLGGGHVDARGDHRIAMAFAMAGLRAGAPISIDNAAAIATSFPGFAALAGGAGLRLTQPR